MKQVSLLNFIVCIDSGVHYRIYVVRGELGVCYRIFVARRESIVRYLIVLSAAIQVFAAKLCGPR